MKKLVLILGLATTIFSCGHSSKENEVSTIDRKIQTIVDSALLKRLVAENALYGQTIVMETSTGRIKAISGFVHTDSGYNKSSDIYANQEETGITKLASYLAALETGKFFIHDSIDTGNGIFSIHGGLMRDHNWRRGGFGKISYEYGLLHHSNIACYNAVRSAFGDDCDGFVTQLKKMSYGKPDSIVGIKNLPIASFSSDNTKIKGVWQTLGNEQQIAPIQILAFFNAIANDGKMVVPQLYEREITVINSQIASRENILLLKSVMNKLMNEGKVRLCKPQRVSAACYYDHVQLISYHKNQIDKTNYKLDFCGYFPANNPHYTVMVSYVKPNLPVTAIQAGKIFKEISDSVEK